MVQIQCGIKAMPSAAREFISVSGNMGDERILYPLWSSLLNIMTNSGVLKTNGKILLLG